MKKKKSALIIANFCHQKTNCTQHFSVVWIEGKQKVKQTWFKIITVYIQNIIQKNFEEKHALKIFYKKNFIWNNIF